MMTAPTRPRTALTEETLHWAFHAEYVRHMWAPCADCTRGDCTRGDCRTARLLDRAADEAARAWGRKTGGW